MNAYPISFSIYAEDEHEAEIGRQGLIDFINAMRARNVAVRGYKIAEAVKKFDNNAFVKNEIIRFFKQ